MHKKYVVCWKQRPRECKEWSRHYVEIDTKQRALEVYNDYVRGDNFGPIEYMGATIAEVLTSDCPHYWKRDDDDVERCIYCGATVLGMLPQSDAELDRIRDSLKALLVKRA